MKRAADAADDAMSGTSRDISVRRVLPPLVARRTAHSRVAPNAPFRFVSVGEEEGPTLEPKKAGAAALLAAKGRLLRHMSKRHLLEQILPILLSLKATLERKRSPLLRQLMLCLCDVLSTYKGEELDQVLGADPHLAREIAYDIKQHDLANPPPPTTRKGPPQTPRTARKQTGTARKAPATVRTAGRTARKNAPPNSRQMPPPSARQAPLSARQAPPSARPGSPT